MGKCIQGYEGVKLKRENRQYILGFKLNVVSSYLTIEMSYKTIANELKINNTSIITRWVKYFREIGIEVLKTKKRGRPSKIKKDSGKKSNKKSKIKEDLTELEKLREKNYYLQLEVESLKKDSISQMT